MADYMTIEDKNRFKSYMVGAGYNITTLAAATGMSREMLSVRISGKVDFGRNEMNKIASVLHISPITLFFGNKVTSNATGAA